MDSIARKKPSRKAIRKSASEGAMPRATTAGSKKEKTTIKNANISIKSTAQLQEAPNAVPPTTTTIQPKVTATARAHKTRSDETKNGNNNKIISNSNMKDRLEGPAPTTSSAGSVIGQDKDTPPPTVLGRSRSATQRNKSKSPNSGEDGPPSLPSTAQDIRSTGAWKPDELVALQKLFESTNGTPNATLRNHLAFDLKRYV